MKKKNDFWNGFSDLTLIKQVPYKFKKTKESRTAKLFEWVKAPTIPKIKGFHIVGFETIKQHKHTPTIKFAYKKIKRR